MTETVTLALIATMHDWGSALLNNMGAVSAGVIAFATFVMQAWSKWSDRQDRQNAERARIAGEAARADIAAKLDQNTQITQAAAMTKDHADLIAKGAERAGVEMGIEIERKRSSGFSGLSTDIVDVSKP